MFIHANMDNIMKITIYLTILILFISSYVFALNNFIPWDADVKIADENIQNYKEIKKQQVTVYNAPQAGGYFLIRFFQIWISPQDGPSCRFHPTCSAYGRISVMRYGVVFGGFLAGDRLIRCNPYTPPGNDPVPDEIFK